MDGGLMRVAVGAGWHIHHLTDRCVELRKDDYLYRRFTERDGVVRVRIEPEMTRAQAIEKAMQMAQRNDEAMALRVSKQLVPSKHALAAYTGKQVRMDRAFATPEDPEQIGVKRA
jgi:hypothetical protein